MELLGLDMATVTGWACADSKLTQPVFASGYIYLGAKYNPPPLGRRLLNWRDELHELLAKFTPDAVVYEVAHFRGGAATRSGVGLESVLLMTCESKGIPIFGVHSGMLKKWACGNGAATKEQMIKRANELLVCGGDDPRITNDNEADAICLAAWGVEHVSRHGRGPHIIEKRVIKKQKGKK